MSRLTKGVSCRISKETEEELEDIAWENRTDKGVIVRKLVNKFLEEEKLRKEILEDLS